MLGGWLHSFIIAKALGLWMLISIIAVVAKREYIKKMVDGIEGEKFAVYSAALMYVFLGLVLVMIHNVWEWNLLALITITCWLILLKGLLWLALPECMMRFSHKIIDSKWFWVSVVITVIYAILLISFGTSFHVLLTGQPF